MCEEGSTCVLLCESSADRGLEYEIFHNLLTHQTQIQTQVAE